jgi:uncharacterized membrane protein YeaQ/YmgE (transglycosylase-associated protein family)
MKTILAPSLKSFVAVLLGAALCVVASSGRAADPASVTNQTSAAPSMAQQVGASAAAATQSVQDAGQTALNGVEVLWQRIDERRLKNRTPDELVGWALMGLLVASLLSRFTKGTQGKALLLGLVGAFLGGIVANVFQLNFGLGPVLIRYEDLICSLVGGIALLFIWSKVAQKMAPKPAAGAAPKPAPAKPAEAKH